MPRRRPRDDDEGFGGADDSGVRDGWESETEPCPDCGAQVYEDADRCSKCGRYVSRSDRTGLPLLFKIVAILLVLGMLIGVII
jgi:hypothetical protein